MHADPVLSLKEPRALRGRRSLLLQVGVVAAGLGSATLFALEPFVCKVLLPRAGGTAAVWNTCMLVFQVLLLLGYGYSVLLSRMANANAVRWHSLFVGAALLLTPWSLPWLWHDVDARVAPGLWLVLVVSGAIGLPFMLLSASSPLLQLWLARSERASAANIHRLYAVTSLANLLGLLVYVAVLEPLLGMRAQAIVLASSAGLALVLCVIVAQRSRAEPDVLQSTAADMVDASLAKPLHWLCWSFLASFLLFAVTTYLAADVAAFPLLFVLPLGVFLLSFALGY